MFALTLHATPSHADEVADFYKGKTVTILVGSSGGGAYDTLARTLARFLGPHIPGQPTVSVRDMAGGGGRAAANALYNGAPKDGSQIGLLPNTAPFEPLMGNAQARYDATRFQWLGSPAVDTAMLAVWSQVPARSLADITTRETIVGASAINSTPAFYARLFNDVFGTRLKVVTGYPGQTEALMAMERRELDGYADIQLTALLVTRADWLSEHKLRPILYYGPQKRSDLAGARYARDLATNEDDRDLLDAAFAPLALGRPFVLPPGAAPDRAAALRQALADTFRDPQFRAESNRLALGADTPQSGERLRDVVQHTYAAAPRVLDRLRKLAKVQR